MEKSFFTNSLLSHARAAAAADLHRLPGEGGEPQRRQAPNPDAGGVEADHISVCEKTQRRPVAEYDPRPAPTGTGGLEPRNQSVALGLFRRPLDMQLEPAVRADVAQACETIDDIAQALRPCEPVVPAIRLVPIHLLEELFGVETQRLLELARATARRRDVPLRRQAGMQQAQIERAVLREQRPMQEPLEQRVAIRRRENVP